MGVNFLTWQRTHVAYVTMPNYGGAIKNKHKKTDTFKRPRQPIYIGYSQALSLVLIVKSHLKQHIYRFDLPERRRLIRETTENNLKFQIRNYHNDHFFHTP